MSIPASWLELIPAFKQGLHVELLQKVAELRQDGACIFPSQERIFYALELTKAQNVRCIILGQDPYHGAGQAEGLAFSVPSSTATKAIPPSLKNIFKEITSDIYEGSAPRENFCPSLERWAKQGVLLLNTVLSVQEGKAHSHAHLGWQNLTKDILQSLAMGQRPLAVLLWGKPAGAYAQIFEHCPQKHLVLQAAHPSPLSAHRGFLGCKHFSKVNAWLLAHNQAPIIW